MTDTNRLEAEDVQRLDNVLKDAKVEPFTRRSLKKPGKFYEFKTPPKSTVVKLQNNHPE